MMQQIPFDLPTVAKIDATMSISTLMKAFLNIFLVLLHSYFDVFAFFNWNDQHML
jgi:hypothetical protein